MKHYQAHVETLQKNTESILQELSLDGLIFPQGNRYTISKMTRTFFFVPTPISNTGYRCNLRGHLLVIQPGKTSLAGLRS